MLSVIKRIAVLLLFGTVVVGQSTRRLDTTSFIVVGEGLAAGVNNFGLSEVGQETTFGALIASQMKTIFPQPVFQSPGIGNTVGFSGQTLRIPSALQTTLRTPFPPQLFVFNLSIPGLRTSESIQLRPAKPLIQQDDPKQTVVNFILGYPQLTFEDEVPLWSQMEYAVSMKPTFAIVELGYYEVIEAAVNGDLSRLPDLQEFHSDYQEIIHHLRSTHAEVMVFTVPDPLDSAYFSDIEASAKLLKTSPEVILGLYALNPLDRITVPGLVEIGTQFIARETAALPSGSVLPSSLAGEITEYVQGMNREIVMVAERNQAVVFDLHGLFREWTQSGIEAGERKLTSDFLGGLFTLNGYYPGPTGHAVIANEVLLLLNQVYSEKFELVTVEDIVEKDSSADFRPSSGNDYTMEELAKFVPREKLKLIQKSKVPGSRNSSTKGNSRSTIRQEGQ